MGAVQFRVLGPLEASRDDRLLRLGGRGPRAVLAALPLEGGRHVGTDALVEAVWGEDAPATAVKGVQRYVSFLRRHHPAGAGPPPDPAGGHRLELRPAHHRRAGAVPAVVGLRRRLHPGGRRAGVHQRAAAPRRDPHRPAVPGGPVAGGRRPPPGRRHPLPTAETLREYARERLTAAEAAELHGRHLRFFLDLAEQAAVELRSPRQRQWLALPDGERDNLRAALRWSLAREGGEHRHGVRLATLLWRYWEPRALPARRGPGSTPRCRCRRTPGRGRAPSCWPPAPPSRCPAAGTTRPPTWRGRAWSCSRRLGASRAWPRPPPCSASPRSTGAITRAPASSSSAAAPSSRGSANPGTRNQSSAGPGACCGCAATTAARVPTLSTSRRRWHCTAASATSTASPGPPGSSACSPTPSATWPPPAATTPRRRGTTGRACPRSAIWATGSASPRPCPAWPRWPCARPATAGGGALTESTARYGELGDQVGVAGCLERFAAVRQAEGDLAPAVWLLGAAQALREASGAVRPAADKAAHAVLVETLREALGGPAFAAAWDAGRSNRAEAQLTPFL